MEYTKLTNKILTIFSTKVLVLILLVFGLAASSLTASTTTTPFNDKDNKFEITAAFISTWEVKEVQDYAVLEVATVYNFTAAYNIVEKLREIVNEPILVKHGYENDSITYKIIIGRFSEIEDAVAFHDTLR